MCASDEDYVMLCKEAKRLKETQEAVVLTRLVKTDIDLALRLFRKFPNLVIKLLVPISDLHIEKRLGFTRGVRKYKLEECLKYLQQSSIKTDVCFEDATRADICYLLDIMDMCSHYEINFITIADTVGCMVPEEFGNLIKKIKNRAYPFKISVHCHNDMGLATANSIAGIVNGAEQVENISAGNMLGIIQGQNSFASPFVGETDTAIIHRYAGPTPPDRDQLESGKRFPACHFLFVCVKY